ncbi:MAG: HlyD family type I secretion periplasmic adaptor subunit [Rhodobacteraceae bacterium]|nr:HlyD family type I secretion periplasmic adaptor subunit [Paracoccaceae bacterium]
MRSAVLLGFATLLALLGGAFAWSALMPLSGAVIATGRIEMAVGRLPIQHPQGGRVKAIFVTEGARVRAGDLLLQLDGSRPESDLARGEARLVQALAERARLEAERDGLDHLRFPVNLAPFLARQPDRERQMDSQMALFNAGISVIQGQKAQIARRRVQIAEQVRGLTAQIGATQIQIELLRKDRVRFETLVAKSLAPIAKLSDLDREIARQSGALGGLKASRAEALARDAEAALESLRLEASRREAAAQALKAELADEEELLERQHALQEELAALNLRAPLSGVVLGLQVTSAAAVLRPAEPALFLVADDSAFVVTAHVATTDIEQIETGQMARLRIGSFDARSTPDIEGTVSRLAADAQSDQPGAPPYYRVEITLPRSYGLRLRPGMPVEVFLATAPRTGLSYLLDPLTRSFSRAFRDGCPPSAAPPQRIGCA